MTRNPAVAGQFYPGTRDSLARDLASLVGKISGSEDAIGLVSPHAGYMYSGTIAGSVYAAIKPRSHYIIMGPNHTGLGGPFGLDANQAWKTPLGNAKIDTELAYTIKRNCPDIKDDNLSHTYEHSIEVQLPFLQFLQKDFKFVPITIAYTGLDLYRKIGEALAKSIYDLKLEKDTLIIASSDMTHYESRDSAKKKDTAAINAILKLDEECLVETISKLDISMCGYGPAAILLVAAKALGARAARLVRYGTSGDASGDYSSVVGYAGIIIT